MRRALEEARRTKGDMVSRYRADPAALMADAGFNPDPWQVDMLRSDAARIIALCARQVGKSSTTAILALYTAICFARSTITVVAPVEEQANELVRKVTTAYANAGQPIGPPIGDAVSKFLLPNGSRIIALPGKESRMRSYSATLLIMDEAARIPDPVFFAALPTLAASGGRFVGLSTAFAKSGWFYDQWHDPREAYLRLSITADQCPRISKDFLEGEKRKLGERWFAMEYFNVFGDDVASVFRGEDIRAARDAGTLPLFPNDSPAPSHTDSTLTPLFS